MHRLDQSAYIAAISSFFKHFGQKRDPSWVNRSLRLYALSLVEFRKNKFEAGLWIHAKNVTMESHLQDVDEATIVELSQVVQASVKRLLDQSKDDESQHFAG